MSEKKKEHELSIILNNLENTLDKIYTSFKKFILERKYLLLLLQV